MSQHKILFTEDDPDICELIAIVFSDKDVVVASGYSHALSRIQTEGPFDLYMLDYYLPDRDGLQLCRAIRQQDPHGPIIFLTGSRSLQKGAVKEAGGQCIVRKSTANFLEELKNNVQALLDPNTDVNSYWAEF